MLISNAVEFGEILQKRRKELGYTQGYLADFTGLSVSFISNLENGKATAELGKALELANVLGLHITATARE